MNLGNSLISASSGSTLKDWNPEHGLAKSHMSQRETKELNKVRLLTLLTQPLTVRHLTDDLMMSEPTVVSYLRELKKDGKVQCGDRKPQIWWKLCADQK